MVNLVPRLRILLPGLNLDEVMLSSRHGLEQIDRWGSQSPKPTQGELAAVTDENIAAWLGNKERERLLSHVRAECTAHIEVTLGWGEYRQRNADKGRLGAEMSDALDGVVSLCRAECNRCEDLIEAGQPYAPVWPVFPAVQTYDEAKP